MANMSPGGEPGVIYVALAVAFIACGVSLRIVGLDWDSGHLFHPDERNIVMAAAALFGDGGWGPDFFAYNGLSIYGPRLVAELVSLVPGAPDGNDLALLSLVCRWLSALSSCATLLVLADCGRLLGDSRGCVIASTFAAFDGGSIQAAHFGTTESALVLAVAVLAWLAINLLKGGIPLLRFALASGATVGLGLALKTTAASFVMLPAVAGLFAVRSFSFRQIIACGAAGGGLAIFVFIALSPYSLIDLQSFRATMRFEHDVVTGAAPVFWTLQFHQTLKVVFQLAQMALMSGPALAGLGLAGALAVILAALARDRSAWQLVPVVCFAVVYSAIVFQWHAKFVRYLLPLTPALILCATWIALAILAKPSMRGAGRMFVGAIVLATAIWGSAFAVIYLRADSRLLAAEWLREKTDDGDVIAIEEREIRPPIPPGREVEILPLLSSDANDTADVLARILSRADWVVVASKRYSQTLPRLPDHRVACSYYLGLALGTLGYDQVAIFERPPGLRGLALPTRFGEETLSVFDHPRVRIYAKVERVGFDEIRGRLQPSTACASLPIGADLLDVGQTEVGG